MSAKRNWTSASWYRVSEFRPRLRGHARIHRHLYRGTVWHVLQDRISGRFHRFRPEAYRLIAMMDGAHTLEEIWEEAVANLDIDAVTQDELVRLVGQLYSADVLTGDIPPDIIELSDRGRRTRRTKLVKSLINPLALRIPVFDPDGFLNATMPIFRPLFTWFGWLIFFGVTIYALVLAVLNFGPLTANVADRVLSAENLVLLLIAYPVIKAFHELGHSYAIKRWGGEVHEIGIMFLVFMPVPYVDASDSIAFQNKWQRALVAAAGILVEMFLAGLAMIVWAGAEEGLIRAFAFNIMLIGGVSTLLFNGNPLLRFDGYYVLCDIIEIPNLGQRANKYLAYLVQKYVFGTPYAETPVTARNERAWFVSYAVAAYVYRLFITAAIIGLVATRFFVVGIALAIWALFLMLVLPLLKGIWFVFTSPSLRRTRGRAVLAAGTVVAGLAGLVLAVPVPHNTMAKGIILPASKSYANATAGGIVEEVFVSEGQNVTAGTPLVVLSDPLVHARLLLADARIEEIERRIAAEDLFDQTGVRIMEEELKAAVADRALIAQRIGEMTVRAAVDGKVILPVSADLLGRFVQRGDLVAVVAQFRDPVVRVAVPEAQADLVRSQTHALDVRLSSDQDYIHSASLLRTVPGLTRALPSRALSFEGGGLFALDPAAPRDQIRTLEPVLLLDLALDGQPGVSVYGEHAFVRFSHGKSPLASRIYRATTRVFLKYFASLDAGV
ncbi:putative peptide zinc metalloprotease protein [Shimia gijangensis]|uniref:Putative peptide zinc metalloprotease protein n=1 Tax=Shimia gijangensis TaxID=1470563 RepID=A0A1M6QCH7_9RHOB|nr:HlyD family efflux transporter periplasmic adaptor subunit [Shimia gijangensis]SHK17876.1 putative peptide zinc metalloprotease protein [Shimia gijangensis]